MPNNYGYIGRNPDDTSVIVARQQFVASGVTTTLTFAAGYTPGYIDAYVNGVRQLEGTDYNATDSTTVSFDTPLANNDNVELVAYKAYDVVGSFIIRKSDCIRKPYSHRTYNNYCKHRKHRSWWIYPE